MGSRVPYTCAPGSDPADGSTTATMPGARPSTRRTCRTRRTRRTAQTTTRSPSTSPTDLTTTVFDTFNGGGAENLGTFNWNEVRGETDASTPPHTVVVKTYTRNIPGVAGGARLPQHGD